ncbi:hypothetical protein D3C87_1379240 [compost metagenome]
MLSYFFHNIHTDVTVNISPPGFYRRIQHFLPHHIFKIVFSDEIIVGHFCWISNTGIATIIARLYVIMKGDEWDEPCLMEHNFAHLYIGHWGVSGSRDVSCNIRIKV